MANNTYCTNEQLADSLNDIFNGIPPDRQFIMSYLSTYLREKANTANEESIKNSLHLLAYLCSPILSFDSKNKPFEPFIVTHDNKCSFMPCDLNNVQLDYMRNILNKITQPQLKARIADFLWTYSSPKDIENLQIAVENYMTINLCNEYFQPDIYDFWYRAAVLAKQTKQSLLINKITEKLLNELKNSSTDWHFHKLKIAEILSSTRLDDNCLADVINTLISEIEKFDSTDFFNESEQYLRFIIEYFRSKKDLDNLYKYINMLAEKFELQGDIKQKESSMVATHFYKLALNYYREIPNKYRAEFNVDASLGRLNSKIVEVGKLIPNELKLISTESIDISELQSQS